jgi:hypothetical protein
MAIATASGDTSQLARALQCWPRPAAVVLLVSTISARDLPVESDAVKLVERCLVKTLRDPVGLQRPCPPL